MSTSKLQRLTSEKLSIFFGEYTIRENYRPDWMPTDAGGRLELDFFIEELNTAIEVQGMQHYEYVEFFHGNYEAFREQQARDRKKKEICVFRAIKLHEIFDEQGLYKTIDTIQKENNLERKSPGIDVNTHERIVIQKHIRKIVKKIIKWHETNNDQIGNDIKESLEMLVEKYDEKLLLSAEDFELRLILFFSKTFNPQPKMKKKKSPRLTPPMSIEEKQKNKFIRRATELTIKSLSKNRFLVSGKTKSHIVLIDQYGNVQCDCDAFKSGTITGFCSHTWKYYQEFGQIDDPKTIRLL